LKAPYPSVAVVILNYNGKHWLEKFLPSVVAYSPHVQIIVADNASTDDSITFLERTFPQIRVIRLDKNYGFCLGYNKALAQIDAKYYILLNSDVEATPNWADNLVNLMESNAGVVIAQPKIKAFDQKTHFEYAGAAGGLMDKWGYAFCRGRIFDSLEEDKGQYNQQATIHWATGACMCVRADWWHKLGGFDEHFFAHFEEIDFGWRVLNEGGKIMYCPDAEVFHVGGGTLHKSNPRKTFLNYRNNLATIYKNSPFSTVFWLIPLRLILDGISGLLFLKKGEFSNIWAIIKAHFNFYGWILSGKLSRSKKTGTHFFKKSVVWQYYAKGKKVFSELEK